MSAGEVPLLVPIRVDAVAFGDHATIAPPLLDFTRLTATVAGPGAQAFVGETVHLDPTDEIPIPSGVHIHWSLPKALLRGYTRYRIDAEVLSELRQQGLPDAIATAIDPASTDTGTERDHDDFVARLAQILGAGVCTHEQWLIHSPGIVRAAATMVLPRAPDRWLVVRVPAEGAAFDSKAWVVESDRLTNVDAPAQTGGGPTAGPPKGGSPSGSPPPAGPPPARPPSPPPTGTGAKQAAADASGSSSDAWSYAAVPDAVTHLWQRLGLRTDAAMWTEPAAGPSTQRLARLTAAGYGSPYFAASYPDCRGVFGLHDDLGAESGSQPATVAYLVVGWFSDAAHDPLEPSRGAFADLAKQCEWAIDGSPAVPAPSRAIFVGTVDRITFTPGPEPSPPDDAFAGIDLAIGSSTNEALAALLAGQAPSQLGLSGEALLDAAGAGLLDRLAEPDGPSAVEDALHERAFQPMPGGTIWTAAEPSGSDPAALVAANVAQAAFDRAQATAVSARQQLYSDVWRFLVASVDGDSSQAVDEGLQASATAARNAVAAIADAADALEQALVKLRPLDAKSAPPKAKAAPRFHVPHDPVLLLSDVGTGDSILARSAYDLPSVLQKNGQRWLLCSIPNAAGPGADPPAFLTAWDQRGALPSAALVQALMPAPPATSGAAPAASWRPLLLGWQVTVTPTRDPDKDYLPDFLAPGAEDAAYTLDPDGVDFVRTSAPAPTGIPPGTYVGRTMLAAGALGVLRDRVIRLAPSLASASGRGADLPTSLQPISTLLADAAASTRRVLAQSLDGFHDSLRMVRRGVQLGAHDPAGNLQVAEPDIVELVGRQDVRSPRHAFPFNPIRNGSATLSQLRLVDAFGRQRLLGNTTDALHVGRTLASGIEGAFELTPRICQPSRLLFGWIGRDSEATGAVPERVPPASPVCAFVVLNRLDESLMFYFHDGSYAGTLDPSASQGRFTAADGTTGVPSTLHPAVTALLDRLASGASVKALYRDIEQRLLGIEPRAHRHHRPVSMLASRPLALCRVLLRLEVQGAPSGVQPRARDLSQETVLTPDLRGHTKVKVAVRLGDTSMDDDGLVLHARLGKDEHGATVIEGASPYHVTSHATGLELTLADAAPTELLLLVDPRAPVHATTGLLPVASLELPPHHYKDALHRLSLRFQIGPVLTPPSTESVQLLTPAAVGGAWTFTDKITSSTQPVSGKVDDRAHEGTPAPVIQRGVLAVDFDEVSDAGDHRRVQ